MHIYAYDDSNIIAKNQEIMYSMFDKNVYNLRQFGSFKDNHTDYFTGGIYAT